ncbi:MAG: DinB family protein, partial [Bacteroidota bacterium]
NILLFMEQDASTELADAFLTEIKRRLFKECVPRLKICLAELTDEEIWYRPNSASNSVGNLVLHLLGNVRQWVVAGLGGQKDIRERQKEFDEQGPIAVEEIIADLDILMAIVAQIIEKTTIEDLLTVRNVQGYQESGLSILVHVTEHFSYHVGQMTYIVKMLKNADIGYYEGHDLNAK